MNRDEHETTLKSLLHYHSNSNFHRDDYSILIQRLHLPYCSDEDLVRLKELFYNAYKSVNQGRRIAGYEKVGGFVWKISQEQQNRFTEKIAKQTELLTTSIKQFSSSVNEHASAIRDEGKRQFLVTIITSAFIAFGAASLGAWLGTKLGSGSVDISQPITVIDEAEKNTNQKKNIEQQKLD